MTSVPFDTLALARRLEKAGFASEQAQETAAALAEAMSPAQLVTRDYLDQRLLLLEQRLIIKVGAIVAAGTAILATLIKLG